jgi:hypothetical protein
VAQIYASGETGAAAGVRSINVDEGVDAPFEMTPPT